MTNEISLETLVDAVLQDYFRTNLPVQPKEMARGMCRVLYAHAPIDEFIVEQIEVLIWRRFHAAAQREAEQGLYRS